MEAAVEMYKAMNNPSQTKASVLALLNDLSADTRKALYDLCVAASETFPRPKMYKVVVAENGETQQREGQEFVQAAPLEALKEIFQQ